MAFLAPLAAGAAGAGAAGAGAAAAPLATTAIGSAGGLSSGALASGLAASPTLAGITPSMVTGASAAIPGSSSLLSSLGGSAMGGLKSLSSQMEGPLMNSLMPKLMGQGGSAPQPIQFPQLQHSQGQPITPVGAPSPVGNAGPLNSGSGAGLSPQMMKLIQMFQAGGGGSGILRFHWERARPAFPTGNPECDSSGSGAIPYGTRSQDRRPARHWDDGVWRLRTGTRAEATPASAASTVGANDREDAGSIAGTAEVLG